MKIYAPERGDYRRDRKTKLQTEIWERRTWRDRCRLYGGDNCFCRPMDALYWPHVRTAAFRRQMRLYLHSIPFRIAKSPRVRIKGRMAALSVTQGWK